MARILITEDERIIAEDLKQTLQSIGHEIVGIASSGEKAIEQAGMLLPDIIFMDIKLEGRMNGVEAAREIRNTIDTSIIFCTAYADDLTLLQISALNPDGYVSKPFLEKEILESIKHISKTKKKHFVVKNRFQTLRLAANLI